MKTAMPESMPKGQTPPGPKPVAPRASSAVAILDLTPVAAFTLELESLRSPGHTTMKNLPSFPLKSRDFAICPTATPSCCAARTEVAVLPGANSMAAKPFASRTLLTFSGIMAPESMREAGIRQPRTASRI